MFAGMRGATIIDTIVIMLILVVILLIGFKADDLYEASYRDRCYSHQRALLNALYQLTADNDVEMHQVLVAYTIFNPTEPMRYRMVVILNPKTLDPFTEPAKGKKAAEVERGPSELVLDLTGSIYKDKAICPLRKGQTGNHAFIDYWYVPTQRWFCLHNEHHN